VLEILSPIILAPGGLATFQHPYVRFAFSGGGK
jgi:hypothetical protein